MTQFEGLTFPQQALLYFYITSGRQAKSDDRNISTSAEENQSFKFGHAEEAFKDESHSFEKTPFFSPHMYVLIKI